MITTLGKRTNLNVEEILQLLEYCLQSTFFSFKGEFYHLTDGVAMGSSISSVVANLFMEELEEEAMKIVEQKGFAPRSWDRYVDDVFSVIKKSNLEFFLEHLNEQDPNIRFTTEEDRNNELPFFGCSSDTPRWKTANWCASEEDAHRRCTFLQIASPYQRQEECHWLLVFAH